MLSEMSQARKGKYYVTPSTGEAWKRQTWRQGSGGELRGETSEGQTFCKWTAVIVRRGKRTHCH